MDPIATCEIRLPAEPPQWVHLLPRGMVLSRDGQAWQLDDPERVIAATRGLAMDLPIDFEHALDDPKGQRSGIAAGWITELAARADGIWGRVEWTEKGAAAVRAGEFRYLSPVFRYDKARQVMRVERAGLTNNPALFLKAVASQGATMNELLKTLAEALGLDGEADEQAVTEKVTELAKDSKTLAAAARELPAIAATLGLAKDATPADIATAAKAVAEKARAAETDDGTGGAKATAGAGGKGEGDTVDPAKFVPRAEFDTLQTAVAELKSGISKKDAEVKVDAAIKDARLTPASRDWALAYCAKDPAGFDDFVAKQPKILKTEPAAEGAPGKGTQPLDETERAVCRRLGLDEAEYIKTREAERAREKEAAA